MLSPAMDDQAQPIHYSAVARGTPVIASDGAEVGKVEQVVDNYREHILDGFVIKASDGADPLRRRARGRAHHRDAR